MRDSKSQSTKKETVILGITIIQSLVSKVISDPNQILSGFYKSLRIKINFK